MIRFIYSSRTFAAKPTDKGVIAGLQKPINYIFGELDNVEDIARFIGEGRTWRAGLYDTGVDSFKKANVKAAQVIAMDFDSCEQEPQAVIDYAISIGVSPSAWYYSYSQGIKTGYNFRIVWVLEEPIKAIQYETIYKAMLEQFSQFKPDESTKDASRMWFGGNRGVNVLNNKPLPLSVLGWLGVVEKVKQGQAIQKARKAVKGCENKYFEDETAEDLEPLYIGQGFKWWEYLRGNKCWLWNRWENGIYLNYNQRLTLFTNLKYIKYADNNQSVVKQVLEIYNKFKNVYEGHTCNEEQIRSMFLNTTLHALGIVRETDEQGRDILTTVKDYLSKTPHIAENNIEKISLEELDKLLAEEMPRLLSEKGIVYIQSQTASGKTYHVIQWLLQQDLEHKKIIYSAPTYNTLEEFRERFTAAYNEANKGKEMPKEAEDLIHFIPRGTYTQEDLLLMELGFPAKTKQNERFKAIQIMLDERNKGLFLCSHQCIAHLRECKADCIIIDENIEEALFNEIELDGVALGGLTNFVENEEKKQMILQIQELIKEKSRGELINIEPLKTALTNFNWERYLNSDNKVAGIGKILEQNKEPPKIGNKKGNPTIRIITKSTLIDNALINGTPIKLLSATPKSALLEMVYNTNKIELFKFPLANNKGQIIQFMGTTGARGTNNSKVEDLIAYVKMKIPEEERKTAYVLSFKDSEEAWEREGFLIPYKTENGKKVPINLSNNAGLDFLKGKTVIVAGKFDNNDDYYRNRYYDMFPDTKTPLNRITKTVEVAGRIRTLYLWDNQAIQDLQIETIKLYLEQSAGRARALREAGAKVYLFANFPIEDADIFTDD